jgi:hypothetical protein
LPGQSQSALLPFSGFVRRRITLQSRGIKLDVAATLRNVETEGSEGIVDGSGLEVIGIALSLGCALIGFVVRDIGTFRKHGFVEEHLEDLEDCGPNLLWKGTGEGRE